MDAQLTDSEIKDVRKILQDYAPAQEAIDALERHDGDLGNSFDELWAEKHGRTLMQEGKSFRKTTLKVLRNELCGDDGFRERVKEYSKSPGSTPLLTGLIVYLVGFAGLPIDPAIATVVVLYILKIGLNVFCEYTQPADSDSDAA